MRTQKQTCSHCGSEYTSADTKMYADITRLLIEKGLTVQESLDALEYCKAFIIGNSFKDSSYTDLLSDSIHLESEDAL